MIGDWFGGQAGTGIHAPRPSKSRVTTSSGFFPCFAEVDGVVMWADRRGMIIRFATWEQIAGTCGLPAAA